MHSCPRGRPCVGSGSPHLRDTSAFPVLDQELDPTAGFTDRALAALPSPPCLSSEPEKPHSWPVSDAIFVLATITAVLLLALAAIASPAAGGAGPDVLVFASLVGIAALKVIPRSVR